MNKNIIRRSIIIVSFSTLFLFVSVVTAFLLFFDEIDNNFTVGEVVVDVDTFFEVETQVIEPVEGVSITNGVIILNINDVNADNFFDNFRVNIRVKSNVDTYFRIIMYEQFTLTTSDGLTEIAITRDEYSQFKFNKDFYDNREVDDYFYYKNTVKRVSEQEDNIISFIVENNNYSHPIYDSKYTIKIGFVIEAVQALDGPLNNWGLENRPWDNLEW